MTHEESRQCVKTLLATFTEKELTDMLAEENWHEETRRLIRERLEYLQGKTGCKCTNFPMRFLLRNKGHIPHSKFVEIAETVEEYFSPITRRALMEVMFRVGYIYGKRAERARKKGGSAV